MRKKLFYRNTKINCREEVFTKPPGINEVVNSTGTFKITLTSDLTSDTTGDDALTRSNQTVKTTKNEKVNLNITSNCFTNLGFMGNVLSEGTYKSARVINFHTFLNHILQVVIVLMGI